MSGVSKDDEGEWGVLTYNLAVCKFQQRHILQVPSDFILYKMRFLLIFYIVHT